MYIRITRAADMPDLSHSSIDKNDNYILDEVIFFMFGYWISIEEYKG